MKSEIVFGDERLQKEFEELKIKDPKLYNQIINAFKNLENDAFCGIQIPKKLIPDYYQKRYGPLSNLWKYNLPDAWRLLYNIKNDKVSILSVILDWIDHKNYERMFKY